MTDLRDFLNWFDGFAENIDKTPSAKQWGKIKERVTALRTATPTFPAGLTSLRPEDMPAKPAPPPKPKVPTYPFIIDHEGVVRRGTGDKKPVTRSEAAGKEIIDLRGMDGDPKDIAWADGAFGLAGTDCVITAA